METEPHYVTTFPTLLALASALRCNPEWLEKGGTNIELNALAGSKKTTDDLDRKSLPELTNEDWQRLYEENPEVVLDFLQHINVILTEGPPFAKALLKAGGEAKQTLGALAGALQSQLKGASEQLTILAEAIARRK